MFLYASLISISATITVVDSGVDLKHKQLSPVSWTNLSETADNGIDDDGNGFIDDIHGWNFAERNNKVIDYEHLDTFPEDCYRYFDIQGKVFLGTASEAEKNWLKQARENAELMTHLRRFANFVHGTHVAGVSAANQPGAKLAAVKLIPTGRAPRAPNEAAAVLISDLSDHQPQDPLPPLDPDIRIREILAMIAKVNADLIISATSYGVAQGSRVINGSFGVTEAPLRPIMESLLSQLLSREATEEEIKHYIAVLIGLLNERCEETIISAEDTLFVFAAGNDGGNNDDMPVAPASVNAGNRISVAATTSRSGFAEFSNYGVQTVDVAAPGVAVRSAIPGDRDLPMSGTSMAAPYVSQTALTVIRTAPQLTGAEVKALIMGTVDRKHFLTDRVASGGIVNPVRALAAAAAANKMGLGAAIALARKTVPDLKESLHVNTEKTPGDLLISHLARPFPLPFPLNTSFLVKAAPDAL